MLDAFIIDELGRREQQEKQADDNRLQLPVPESQNRRPTAPERRPAQDGFEMPSQNSGETIVIDMADHTGADR